MEDIYAEIDKPPTVKPSLSGTAERFPTVLLLRGK